MLDFHSQARCHGEIFGDGKPPTYAAAPERDPEAFLRRMLTRGSDERAIGFKLPSNSIRITPRAAEVVRRDLGISVIRLSRRNRLAQLVSRQLLATTGISQSIFGDYGAATVRIEPPAFLAALARMEEEEQMLDGLSAGHRTLPISYEQLGDEACLIELQGFLGLDPEPLRSWYERLRARPLPEVIDNWEELEAALRGTPHERFLEEE